MTKKGQDLLFHTYFVYIIVFSHPFPLADSESSLLTGKWVFSSNLRKIRFT